ncbi:Rsp5p-dependent ubiquitination, sorting of cargo proteins at the multivesicular body [Nowakowskiella sp. JEL0078]|nr:Rsp5p-dependent ubiquitination, sorting of cargo proteins at the multivesicular body [Nowakowskiella sp. JEL0078]
MLFCLAACLAPVSAALLGCPQLCKISAIPSKFVANSTFYSQFLIGSSGIPVMGSMNVSQEGMFRTFFQIEALAAQTSTSVISKVVAHNLRVSIFAQVERITDLPENQVGTNGASGLFISIIPGTNNVAACLVGEKSSLFQDGGTTFHELGHATEIVGMDLIDLTFHSQIQKAYNQSLSSGLWANSYAKSQVAEYWAEGSRIWFGCSTPRYEGEPANRDGLKTYDSGLYDLLAKVYVNTTTTQWTYQCLSSNEPVCDRNVKLSTGFECPTNAMISTSAFTVVPSLADPSPDASRNGNTTSVVNIGTTSNNWTTIAVAVSVGLFVVLMVVGSIVYMLRRKNRNRVPSFDDAHEIGVLTPYGLENFHEIQMDNLNALDYAIVSSQLEGQPINSPPLADLIKVIETNGASTNHLIKSPKSSGIVLDNENMDVIFDPFDGAKSVRSQYPLTILKPGEVEFYYFEIEIIEKESSCLINVGLCDNIAPIFTSSPGWITGSNAFSSDGLLYRGFSPVVLDAPRPPIPYNSSFKVGDFVGVGHDPTTGALFLTVNGVSLNGIQGVDDIANRKDLFACIGADGFCRVKANFGGENFLYNVANYIRDVSSTTIHELNLEQL